MIHTGELVARMARQDSAGARIPFSLRYYKANGARIDVPSATFLSLDRPSDTVLILCPGGPRRIRLYCIVALNGEEVYI